MKKVLIILSLLLSTYLFSDNLTGWERNEYKNGFIVEVKATKSKIEFKVYGKTKGWVSIGFEPTLMMKDSDIIIGYVKNEKVFIEDHYSHKMTGHKADLSLGGENNIEIIDGNEVDGVTMLHFSMPLESVDKFDKSLSQGKTYKIIFATGKSDIIKSKHNFRGSDRITIPLNKE